MPTARGSASEGAVRAEDGHLRVPGNAASAAHRALPPVPPGLAPDAVSIALLYQYVEPAWTKKQHKAVLSKLNALAAEHGVTGRGRCAREGVNCTLTGAAAGLRAFCMALRTWDKLFEATDFKLEDGLEARMAFKAFSLRKTDELVNYDLEHEKAPSIRRHGGVHLDATEYHEAMKRPSAVIVDVRNAYESAIGHFQPPEGGARLIDPKMRNSSDFAKWLHSKETKKELSGKDVMLYCTGGIRCERASALLNQMAEADPKFEPKSCVQVRGGIERYLKTFPEGGFWKGRNYLFDKRMEQKPELKSNEALEADCESQCCVCAAPRGVYRGKHKCGECRVPVIVCPACVAHATAQPATLRCPLCVEGYEAPSVVPDLVAQKRQLGVDLDMAGAGQARKKARREGGETTASGDASRLYVRHIPLVVRASQLREALGEGVELIHWLADSKTGAFYGAAVVAMASTEAGRAVIARAEKSIKMVGQKKRLQVSAARRAEGEAWPPSEGYVEREFPPIGSA